MRLQTSDMFAVVLMTVIALGVAMIVQCGCSPSQASRAATAAELAAYGAALERCYANTAGMPYSAYEGCARDADRKFGVTHDPR